MVNVVIGSIHIKFLSKAFFITRAIPDSTAFYIYVDLNKLELEKYKIENSKLYEFSILKQDKFY